MHIAMDKQTHGGFYHTLVLSTVLFLAVDVPREAHAKGQSADSFRRQP